MIYSEYLKRQMSFEQLAEERKQQLNRISAFRKRPVFSYASDSSKPCPSNIDDSDIVPFVDQLASISGDEIDIILETPGGYAEVVEDLVRYIRSRFARVGIIVPGKAKSAGTIFTMAADEILMGQLSSLGPIDAQILNNGKRYSADALLQGLEKIKDECNTLGRLEIAYIPILQQISPGEIQHCENAQAFSQMLVRTWLKDYKFKYWEKHTSTGNPVTEEEKQQRASSIAGELCKHSRWLTHGRSIKIEDLQKLGLQIFDYSKDQNLNDAITRYHTLIRMSFETNIYKIYETAMSQIYRTIHQSPQQPSAPVSQQLSNPLVVDFECNKCKAHSKIQVNFGKEFPQMPEINPFPKHNIYKCPSCGAESNLLGLRQQLEAQTKNNIV